MLRSNFQETQRHGSYCKKHYQVARATQDAKKTAKINVNTVPALCADHSEANEVMISAILVNQYVDESKHATNEEIADPFVNLNETLRSNVVEHLNQENEQDSQVEDDMNPFQVDICEAPYKINLPNAPPSIINISKPHAQCKTHHQAQGEQRHNEREFMGACLDTGAQRSVCGRSQAI